MSLKELLGALIPPAGRPNMFAPGRPHVQRVAPPQGTWGTKFDADKTVKGNFVTAAGKKVPCHMMRRTDKEMHHRETPEVHAVRLPYVGGFPL